MRREAALRPREAPFGAWPSPLSAADAAAGSVRLGDLGCDGEDVLFVEGRPAEGGRCAVVRCGPDGRARDALPAPHSARSRVHEYGGGAWAADRGTLWYCDAADQRLLRLDPGAAGPRPLTAADGRRYADLVVDAARGRLLAVCEDGRGPGEPRNTLVSVPWDGGPPRVLVEGPDFVASPRLAPDGRRLAWLAWDHPHMPWDAAALYEAALDGDGTPGAPRRVAGGPGASVFQPGWAPAGALHFVAERGGWWRPCRERAGRVEVLCEREAEFGLPQWAFRMATWAFLPDGRIAQAFCEEGIWRLGLLDPQARRLEPVDLPWTQLADLVSTPGGVAFTAASPAEPPRVAHLGGDGAVRVLRRPAEAALERAFVAVPESVRFPTGEGGRETAHGFLYRPRHPGVRGPSGGRPPLLVKGHGGPTGASAAVYDPRVQFWTTRGFAVLDVNYRGSTGFGRAYRERLRGGWGVVDREDCERGARFLAERGDVDARRLAITGGSAGGYTALCALAFGDTFHAGGSWYGVSDLEALVRETHKFEARYLDGLVAPWPAGQAVYRARSPLRHADRLDRPVIFFQGSEDPVCPPAQAERMVEALRRKGIDVEYVRFEGEGHGFRRAASLAEALERELAFYRRVLGIPSGPADG